MIIVRAPMRISFVGGGTDLPEFYLRSPGRVISTAINKYVYVTINRPPLLRQISARYSTSELVDHPRELKNDRIREALLSLGITSHIDVGSSNDAPVKTGLGSSSSFSVALMKALLVAEGKDVTPWELAEHASRLEIDLVKEPIGKQDQYAAAFGGFNVFQFNADHSVDVSPVRIDGAIARAFENHIQVFFTGITRHAASVLAEQKANTEKKLDTLKKMAEQVFEFQKRLLAGDFEGLGAMLHEGWLLKKTLAGNMSLPAIDDLYSAGRSAGAWGGKLLGAGGGGCVMFITEPGKKRAVAEAVVEAARRHHLEEFTEIPVQFAKSGAEVLLNHEPQTQVHFS